MKAMYSLDADRLSKLTKELTQAFVAYNIYSTVTKTSGGIRRIEVTVNLVNFPDLSVIQEILTKLDLHAAYSAGSGWRIRQWQER